MSKAMISLSVFKPLVFITLSITVITGVFTWMDNNTSLISETALQQAEQSLAQYCQQQGINASDLKLVDASAPEAGKQAWHFRFESSSGHPIMVEVRNNSKSSTITKRHTLQGF